MSTSEEQGRLVEATAFYDPLADGYDLEFEVPHRRAYDDLAWEVVCDLLGDSAGDIVDAGCGTARLAARLIDAGHRVIGVEPAAAMADAAQRRQLGDRFTLHRCGIDDAPIAARTATLVMAMGSVQFTPDPHAALRRMAGWVRPGGHLVVLCDSLGGLVNELLGRGDLGEATERARTRRARWVRNGLAVTHHLLDAATLRDDLAAAGLTDVRVSGLLVGFGAMGRDAWNRMAETDFDSLVALERELSAVSALADGAKQLLAVGRAPHEEPARRRCQ